MDLGRVELTKRRVLGVLGRVLKRGRGRDRHDLGGTDWEAGPEPISLIESPPGGGANREGGAYPSRSLVARF